MTLSQEELDRYKEVTEKATPGPFETAFAFGAWFVVPSNAKGIYVSDSWLAKFRRTRARGDAEFLALSRTMAPKLLREIKELREENERLRTTWEPPADDDGVVSKEQWSPSSFGDEVES